MVDILETIQEKYVPFITVQNENGEFVTSADTTIFFGGDQLTEESARNIQRARADGQNQKERLEAVYRRMRTGMPLELLIRSEFFISLTNDVLSLYFTCSLINFPLN
jgi:hypothetical protein